MDYSAAGTVTSYEVQFHGPLEVSPWQNHYIGLSTTSSFTMMPDTSWEFRVRACNTFGCSAYGMVMGASTGTP
jgi:hypothetical protein